MAYQMLSPTVQKKIWDMEWRQLTAIQEAAIPVILARQHCVLMAGTASGKTEAAFLPVLSALEQEGQIGSGLTGVKVLYISPLRALINDQFERVERLTDTLDIPLLKWHGDVSRSKKQNFLSDPRGIVQITPESLEALLVNQTDKAAAFFREVEFIIIDELHAFLESDRGLQVQSLLARMRPYMRQAPVMIGLSATIGEPLAAQAFLQPDDPQAVQVLNPPEGKRQIFLQVDFFAKENSTLSAALVEDIWDLTQGKKAILFCNSRGQVEELTHKLNALGQKRGGPLYVQRYFPHHSSIDKAEREWVETQMKTSTLPMSVVSTNTLELGIDIGALDLVVQVDATYSVSSLKQRLGRSGRREGADSYLMVYATEAEDLLQAVAVTELLFDKWLEPPEQRQAVYDLLFHQVLSMCTERQGIYWDDLLAAVAENRAFAELNSQRVQELFQWMLEEEWLELVQGQCIVGVRGEKLVRSRDFYAVFRSPALYKVMHGTRLVGTIEQSPLVQVGESLLLSGGMWTIVDLDDKRGIVYVELAVEGKKPIWLSGTRILHPRIADKMYEVYTSEADLDYLSPRAWHQLRELRLQGKSIGFAPEYRVMQEAARSLTLYDFAGTKRQNALAALIRGYLREQEWSHQVKQSALAITIDGGEIEQGFGKRLLTFLLEVLARKQETKYLLMGRAAEPERGPAPKFAAELPKHFQRLIEDELERDVEGLRIWLREQKWKVVRPRETSN